MTFAADTPRRLVVVGGILVDLVLGVDVVPETGGDVLAREATVSVGGAFNVVSAAARQEMPVAFLGRVGTGRFGLQALGALRDEAVEVMLAATTDADTGFCVVLVDATGERTMVTTMGVEARLREEDLAAVTLAAGDLVYVSGYDLAYPHGPRLVKWLVGISAGVALLFDPGPLVGDLSPELLNEVLVASRWLSLNQREAQVLTGTADASAAAQVLLRDRRSLHGVVVRSGAEGCTVAVRGGSPEQVPGFPASVADTTGAGDAHVGAFAAALSRGCTAVEACRWANAAASVVVARWGAATAPGRAQTQRLLDEKPADD